jgi:hypothetical protein
MNKKNIIPGYKGIMPLDLTNVDKKLHNELIKQHHKDIILYKKEQNKLPKHLQYDNTIGRVKKQWEIEEYYIMERIKREKKEQEKQDQTRLELYYNNCKT